MSNEKEIKDLKNIIEYVDVERQLVVYFGDDFFDDNYICFKAINIIFKGLVFVFIK